MFKGNDTEVLLVCITLANNLETSFAHHQDEIVES